MLLLEGGGRETTAVNTRIGQGKCARATIYISTPSILLLLTKTLSPNPRWETRMTYSPHLKKTKLAEKLHKIIVATVRNRAQVSNIVDLKFIQSAASHFRVFLFFFECSLMLIPSRCVHSRQKVFHLVVSVGSAVKLPGVAPSWHLIQGLASPPPPQFVLTICDSHWNICLLLLCKPYLLS